MAHYSRRLQYLVVLALLVGMYGSAGLVAADRGTDDPALRVVVIGEYTLQQPRELGAGVPMGGFSGLSHVPGDPANVFYTVMDRGPNGSISGRRTFVLPDLVPTIVKLRLAGNEIEVLDEIPIRQPNGLPASVLPQLSGDDEVPFDRTGQVQLALNPHGLDLEGIAYSANDDTFWLADEYRGSIVQVRRDGTIVQRLVPTGQAIRLGASYARDAFPSYFDKRPKNRGLEGLAITPDGRYLYATQQNPLQNPSAAVGNTSRVVRFLKLDLQTGQQVGEFIYLTEPASSVANVAQADISLSDLYALNEHELLVIERDKNETIPAPQIKRIYRVNFSGATNVMNVSGIGGVSIEAMSEQQRTSSGVVAGSKQLVLDVLQVLPDYPHEKIEGLTMLDERTLAICNDNDYGVEVIGADPVPTGERSQCHVFKLLP